MIAKSRQETRAEMIGTTRSHVILFMDKFLKLGSIDYISGIEVHGSLLKLVLREQLEIRPCHLRAVAHLIDAKSRGCDPHIA